MADITLVRQDVVATEDLRSRARSLLSIVDGLTEKDRKRWRNWLGRMCRLEPGEMSTLDLTTKRHGAFHRRHLLIESRVFDAQERIVDFDQFRNWLKVGAGFVDWLAGPKGGVIPVPRSISYAKCDEETMRTFHDDAIAFFRGPHAAPFLWKHLAPARAHETMDEVLSEFDE